MKKCINGISSHLAAILYMLYEDLVSGTRSSTNLSKVATQMAGSKLGTLHKPSSS
jgi:hypothetical protein